MRCATEEKMTITKETIIGDILDYDIEAAKFFMEIGMHCLGCPASRGESLEMACEIHGVDVDDLVSEINKFLAEKNDKNENK
jgi:hybrid cluster-associated redox disulfide protein